MLSKNAVVTDVDSIIPIDLLFTMFEKEYYLERVELWDFIKNCSALSPEDKKTLLLLFFLTRNKNDGSNEPESRILEVWEEIDKRLNLSSRKKKTLSQLVKELPEVWKNPCKVLMRTNPKGTDEIGYDVKGRVRKLKSRQNGRRRVNIYRLDQSFSFVKVTSKVSKNSKEMLSLVVDTGASVSVIKADVIDPRIVVVLKKKVELIGIIQNELLESLGTCNIPLHYGDKRFIVEFHVISQVKNLPFDGVLGRNFLEEHLVTIDYAKQELLMKAQDWVIPFFNQMATFHEQCLIKGHAERVVEVLVKNSNIVKGYIPQCELNKGLLLCRAIVKMDKDTIVTATIRNIGPIERVVEPFCIELLPLQKFVEKDWPIVEASMKTPTYKEIEDQFTDFMECLSRNDSFPDLPVQEFNAKLHKRNALFCPMNIDRVHFYSKIINSVYRINPVKPPGLYKVKKIVSERMTTYLCTDRYLYIEQPSTKDTFITLYNLKQTLVKEKFTGEFFIVELNRIRMETSRNKLFKMIHFIFQHTEIEPVVVMRRIRTPKTENEKFKVIHKNHIDKKNKHYGYMRTYNKIRDGFVWSTIKEDLMDYMLKCSVCKYNLAQFRALHKVLPAKPVEKKERPLQTPGNQ